MASSSYLEAEELFVFEEDELRYGLARYQEDLRQNEKGNAAAGDSKNASKRGAPSTRGTAISFGFRRRNPAQTGIPVPVSNNNKYIQEQQQQHQRSKSVGPEHESRRRQTTTEDDYYYQPPSRYQNYPASGRSTPRLAPPKKEASGQPLRTNRFGFRNHPVRFTDKVSDLTTYNSHTTLRDISLDRNSPHLQQQFRNVHHNYNQQHQEMDTYTCSPFRRPGRQPRSTSANPPGYNNNNNNNNNNPMDNNRATRYTTQTSGLPIPQFARVGDSSSKIAKTMANQNRKVGTSGRMTGNYYSSKEGSGTEDSGIGSHGGCSDENGGNGSSNGRSRYDYYNRQGNHNARPRKLGVVLNGKSFDVRDVDEEQHTVTEISVIQLPQNFAQQQLQQANSSPNLNQSTGIVRERMSQYQRLLLSKDNRYMDSSSTTSVSTTSSEGYGEGLDEEKVLNDRARTEKLPMSSSSSMMRSTDFSVASSADEQEYGGAGGEAMADEYCFSSVEDFHNPEPEPIVVPSKIVPESTRQQFKAISNAAKNGTLANSTLRSVLLTIEDPAFAAVAATTTTLIDDETSPVDSLFDSPTASVSQSDVKVTKKEANVMERSGDTIENCDSPGTPTNASNSLSLSEGREFFDDEIADQPGLVFDEGLDGSIGNTDHSQTVLETMPKITSLQQQQGRSVENSPVHGRKMNRAGSVSTLSSCESLASDDLMMDFERSDASSFGGDVNSRGNSTFIMQDLDDATSLLELELQGQEVMREWNSLLGQSQLSLNNSANNNINTSNINNNQSTESGEPSKDDFDHDDEANNVESIYQLTFPG